MGIADKIFFTFGTFSCIFKPKNDTFFVLLVKIGIPNIVVGAAGEKNLKFDPFYCFLNCTFYYIFLRENVFLLSGGISPNPSFVAVQPGVYLS